jgi:hypothetical protein
MGNNTGDTKGVHMNRIDKLFPGKSSKPNGQTSEETPDIPIQYPGIKNNILLAGWITGLLVIITLIWILTQPIQTYYLLRTVNSVFINTGDSRRLTAHIDNRTGKSKPLGYWYLMHNSTDKMFIFAVFQDGILIPLGAIVSDDNTTNTLTVEIIPLSKHASQTFNNLPQSILQMYITRIETAYKQNFYISDSSVSKSNITKGKER